MDRIDMKTRNGLENQNHDLEEAYVSPQIITYTHEEILERIGPAMACSPEPTCPVSV